MINEQDPWKLHFPVELVDVIGLSKNEIAFLKKRGCPFHGKKTCVAWVRDFLAKAAGGPSPLQIERPQPTAVSRSGARVAWSGSSTASPATR
jgi:hypothetical protein